jgi:flagellar motility protein MotE (MotC chaperone)
MNKIVQSPWLVVLLGIVLGLGTEAGLLISKIGGLKPQQPLELDLTGVPDKIQWSFLTPALDEMREELRTRLEKASARESELDEYAMRLQAERSEIEKLKSDLESMRTELTGTFFEIQSVEEKNLKTLANTYTGLSPTAALAIFREMDDEMVVKILAFMKPEPVANILEEMTKTMDGDESLAARAASISNKLRLKRQVASVENN